MAIFYLEPSDMIYDFTCSSCDDNGVNSEAFYCCLTCSELLCGPCEKLQKVIHRNHKVLGKKDEEKWVSVRKDAHRTVCQLHEAGDTETEMYCTDHDEIYCSVCLPIKHGSCKQVKTLSEASKDILQQPEFKSFSTKTITVLTEMYRLKENREKTHNAMQECCTHIKLSIQLFRKEINKRLDDLEIETLDEMKRLHENFENTVENDIGRYIQIKDTLKKCINDLHFKEQTTDSSTFIAYKECQKYLQAAEMHLDEMRKQDDVLTMKFIPNRRLEQCLSSMNFLGEFKTLSNVSSADAYHIYKVEAWQRYNVNVAGDKDTCNITGSCLLPSGHAIIADHSNKKIKLLDQHYDIGAYCDIAGFPIDVCTVTDTEVAVTVNVYSRKLHEIHFIDTKNAKLKMKRKLLLEHCCRGIAHHNGGLYVSSGTAVYTYSMEGQLLYKLYEDMTTLDTIGSIALANHGRSLYIANPAKHSVTMTGRQGNVLSVYMDTTQDLKCPIGVCVGDNSSMFVCGLHSHTIMQRDHAGNQKLRSVVGVSAGIRNPVSLCFRRETAQLIVGLHNDNTIAVFDLL